MKLKYFVIILFMLILITPYIAYPVQAQYEPGRICVWENAITGDYYSCRYYAYAGDVLTLSCQGCASVRKGNLFSGFTDIPAWRFIYRGANDTYDPDTDPVLLTSTNGSPRTYTVDREGMYQLTASVDFGTTYVAPEIEVISGEDTNNCGVIGPSGATGCMGYTREVVTNPGGSYRNVGTVAVIIELESAGPNSPHNPANQPTSTPKPTTGAGFNNFGTSSSGSDSGDIPLLWLIGGGVLILLVVFGVLSRRRQAPVVTSANESNASRYGDLTSSSSRREVADVQKSVSASPPASKKPEEPSNPWFNATPKPPTDSTQPANEIPPYADDKPDDNPWLK